MSGERVKPDGLIDLFDSRTSPEYPDEAPAFLRSTILRVIDEGLAAIPEATDGTTRDKQMMLAGERTALLHLRARFEEADDD